jgi:hypothetical protein
MITPRFLPPKLFQTGYRNIFYIATDNFKLGTSNTTPNLRIEVSCVPQAFVNDAGELPGWFKLTDAEGDVWPPLIIYEYLRNETWGGAGLSVDDIDFDSFLDATEQCIAEGVAITALQDSAGTDDQGCHFTDFTVLRRGFIS